MSGLLLGIIIGLSICGRGKKRTGGGCKVANIKLPINPDTIPPTPGPSTHSIKILSSKQSKKMEVKQ